VAFSRFHPGGPPTFRPPWFLSNSFFLFFVLLIDSLFYSSPMPPVCPHYSLIPTLPLFFFFLTQTSCLIFLDKYSVTLLSPHSPLSLFGGDFFFFFQSPSSRGRFSVGSRDLSPPPPKSPGETLLSPFPQSPFSYLTQEYPV